MTARLLGEVVHHDGYLCLQTSPRVFYPLDGASGIAEDFRDAFGRVQSVDVGKRVYRVRGGVLQMENHEQRDARKAQNHG